jgi:hypothetical protein
MYAAHWNLRDARNRQGFALQRALEEMAVGERQLARALDALDQRLDLVEHDLDQELRRAHWGHEPERLPAWRSHRRTRDPRRRRPTDLAGFGGAAAAQELTEVPPPSVRVPDPAFRDRRMGLPVRVNDELAAVTVT